MAVNWQLDEDQEKFLNKLLSLQTSSTNVIKCIQQMQLAIKERDAEVYQDGRVDRDNEIKLHIEKHKTRCEILENYPAVYQTETPMMEDIAKDKNRGLYNKFNVTRADGKSEPGQKHENCRYFVLDLDHDEFAMEAIRAYAHACQEKYPKLAIDLFRLADNNIIDGVKS